MRYFSLTTDNSRICIHFRSLRCDNRLLVTMGSFVMHTWFKISPIFSPLLESDASCYIKLSLPPSLSLTHAVDVWQDTTNTQYACRTRASRST